MIVLMYQKGLMNCVTSCRPARCLARAGPRKQTKSHVEPAELEVGSAIIVISLSFVHWPTYFRRVNTLMTSRSNRRIRIRIVHYSDILRLYSQS